MNDFIEWLRSQEESTAFTRKRWNAAMGLGPSIPDASIHSHSTAWPGIAKKIEKRNKKSKKKGRKG